MSFNFEYTTAFWILAVFLIIIYWLVGESPAQPKE